MQPARLKVARADAPGDFGDGVEGKLLPRASPCALCVRKTRRAPIDENAVPQEDFQNMKLGRQFVLSLRTILVSYDFDDNTPADSGAEGGCFAKGTNVEFTPDRASHESHAIPDMKKRYSVGVSFSRATPVVALGCFGGCFD